MQPVRKVVTRSRNGCAVCKSKRLKCDEAKPYCSRCQRLGISCPGYRKPLRWNASSTSPRENPTSSWTPQSGSVRERSGNSFHELQMLEETPKDLTELDFFNVFMNSNTPESIDTHDMSTLEPFFPLPDMGMEKEHPSPTTSSDATFCLQQLESRNTESSLSRRILKERTVGGCNVIDPHTPLGELATRRYETPLSPSLKDNSSTLVEYYFKEVCGMMSCYDSNLNPYRTTISKLWVDSPSLYYIIQSMAAACLSEVSPSLSASSGRLGDQAVKSLRDENKINPTDTSSLLALVMLGFSLCWHDPRKLGQAEFRMLAETLLSIDNLGDESAFVETQKKLFFYNSLVYWKMLLSFVTDQELPSLGSPRAILPQPCRYPTQDNLRIPHPQTGLGVEIQELVAQVGALVRRERKRIRGRKRSSRHDIEQSLNAIRIAEELHSKLCKIELPNRTAIVDSGDDTTPADHLLKAAEAYRCTGLLQLYQNFPDLLLQNKEFMDTGWMDESLWLEYSSVVDTAQSDNHASLLATWLTSLALHVLDLVQEIPMSSRSRSIQPLLLVSICSELSLNRTFTSLLELRTKLAESRISSPRMEEPPAITDVLHARRLILSRLSFFEGVLAAKPIRQMLTLVKETWAWMDKNEEDVYWMDIMIERGYETLMG